MIVPFDRSGKKQGPAQPQPSETDMLMALAAMHSMGRVGKAAKDEDKLPQEASPA